MKNWPRWRAIASQSHRICVADSSSSRHLSQMWSSTNPNLKRCPFRWQCPVNSPTIHFNWSLFDFRRSFVLLAEDPDMSPFACLSPIVDSHSCWIKYRSQIWNFVCQEILYEICYDMMPKSKNFGVREVSWRSLVKICFCGNEYAHDSRGIVDGGASHLYKVSQWELSNTESLGSVSVIGGCNQAITTRRYSKLEELEMYYGFLYMVKRN
jgi:hypothetical protein